MLRYREELRETDVLELAIHRWVSRLNHSRRCAEASAVKAQMEQGLPLAPGMKITYVVKDAKKWEVDPERNASRFDAGYYGGLLEKAWGKRLRLSLGPSTFKEMVNCTLNLKRRRARARTRPAHEKLSR